jgi:hypothetical protein
MSVTIRPADDTAPFLLRLRPIQHDGLCGWREQCWRPECRAEFGEYQTVERWPDTGRIIARCHGSEFTVLGMTERAA